MTHAGSLKQGHNKVSTPPKISRPVKFRKQSGVGSILSTIRLDSASWRLVHHNETHLLRRPPRCFGGRGKKLGAVLPRLVTGTHQSEPGFMHQCGRLKLMPRLLLAPCAARRVGEVLYR